MPVLPRKTLLLKQILAYLEKIFPFFHYLTLFLHGGHWSRLWVTAAEISLIQSWHELQQNEIISIMATQYVHVNQCVSFKIHHSIRGEITEWRKTGGQPASWHINKVQLFCLVLNISGNLLIRLNGSCTPPNRTQLRVQSENLFYLSDRTKPQAAPCFHPAPEASGC